MCCFKKTDMHKSGLVIIFVLLFSFTKGQTAPDFQVTDIDGDQHHLYSILADSNFVLIDFFFVNCSYCQYYAPHVNQSYLNSGCNNHDVYVLGIDYDDDSSMVRQFQKDYQLDYPLVSGLHGDGNSVVSSYNIQSFPTVMIVGPDSNIWKILNTPTTENIDSMLTKLGSNMIPCNTPIKKHSNQSVIEAWPNPVSTTMTIRWKIEKTARIRIMNLSGQIKRSVTMHGKQTKSMNLNNLANGIYLMHIQTNKKSYRHFFIKK